GGSAPNGTYVGGTPSSMFDKGESVPFCVTIQNVGPTLLSNVSISDTVPAALTLPSTADVLLDGAACTSCTLTGTTLNVTGINIAAGASRTLTLAPLAVGVDRACAATTNDVLASHVQGTGSASAPFTVCDGGL